MPEMKNGMKKKPRKCGVPQVFLLKFFYRVFIVTLKIRNGRGRSVVVERDVTYFVALNEF